MAANNADASSAGESINTDIITLTRFLTEEQTKHKEATGDFTYVAAVAVASAAANMFHFKDSCATRSNLRSRAYHTTSGEQH